MTSNNTRGQPGFLGRRAVAAFGAAAPGLVAAGTLAMTNSAPAWAAAPPEVCSEGGARPPDRGTASNALTLGGDSRVS